MSSAQPNNPLHGMTLEMILTAAGRSIWLGGARRTYSDQMFYGQSEYEIQFKIPASNSLGKEKS